MAGVTTYYQTGIHAARPANGSGCVLYSCTTHNKVYRDDGTTWTDFLALAAAGLADPMTTRGDIIVRDSSNLSARLAAGAANTVLKSDGTDVAYGAVTPAMLDVSADITTANATSGHHGLLPKLSGSSGDALLGDGTWGAVAGGGGALASHPLPLDSYAIDGTYGDDFTAASLSGSWTRRNFTSGNETYQTGKAGTFLRLACGARAVGDAYHRAAPAGDWTMGIAFINRNYTGTPGFGLTVVDTAGTGVFANMYNAPQSMLVYGVSTYTSYGGSFVQVGGGASSMLASPVSLHLRKMWISLRKSGTSYYTAYSLDGEAWSPESAAFTWAGTVNRVGFGFGPLGDVQGANTAAVIDVDWFNKLA